jgi:trehalose 6-phosphate phosphatase
VFLDLDGTLAPIAARPDMVGPDSRRNALLGELSRALDGRVAIISGRAILEVDRILDGCVACVAGLHGLERRGPGGGVQTAEVHSGLAAALPAARAFAADYPAMLVEDKKLAIALHYREAPETAAQAVDFARRLAWMTGLKLQEGQMVVELRSPGDDKGDMVRAFMAEDPFKGHRPLFIGDDLTDEDGFAAAAKLDGYGVLVGSPRQSLATGRLPDVDAVLDWLQDAIETGGFRLPAFQ